jgi:hypothetical protein
MTARNDGAIVAARRARSTDLTAHPAGSAQIGREREIVLADLPQIARQLRIGAYLGIAEAVLRGFVELGFAHGHGMNARASGAARH